MLPTTFLSNKSEFIRKALLNYWDYAYKGQNNILQDYSTNSFRFIVHMYSNQNFWKEFSKCTCTNIYRYVFVCDDQIIAHHVLQIHTMPTDFDIPVTVKIINSCCTSNSVSSFSYNHSAGIKARVTSKVWKKKCKIFLLSHFSFLKIIFLYKQIIYTCTCMWIQKYFVSFFKKSKSWAFSEC